VKRFATLRVRLLATALILSITGFAFLYTVHPTRADSASFETLQSLKANADDDPIAADDGAPANNVPNATGQHDNGHRGNVFANDPCLDPLATAPAPANRRATVQSETTIGVLRRGGSKDIVVGYNDSFGFFDNTQGLTGFAYSVDGGQSFVDGGALPPLVKAPNGPFLAPGADWFLGDPVLAVDQKSGTFYYASLYEDLGGHQTVSVSRGHFAVAPPSTPESNSNTRCAGHPELQGVPDTTNLPALRPVWEPPVVAVNNLGPGDALDKEWIFVNQQTGELYITYTRFNGDGSTPLELVRSTDGGHTFTAPTTIVPNLNDTFNQATQPVVTPSGRVIVSYIARTFADGGAGPEDENRIEVAVSNDDGATFSTPIVVARVNPEAEPLGYNRGRRSILNAPFITVNDETGAVYLTYFNGKTPLVNPDGTIFLGPLARAGDILLSTSTDGGSSWGTPVKVNDDAGTTSHVFPSVQVNDENVFVGWIDRRLDPANQLTNEWADVSHDGGHTFGADQVESDVATTWNVRADARPNFGDYNSSALVGGRLALVWADGRFGQPAGSAATPDTIFTVATGLGD